MPETSSTQSHDAANEYLSNYASAVTIGFALLSTLRHVLNSNTASCVIYKMFWFC